MVSRDQVEKTTLNKIHIETIEGSPSASLIEINGKQVRCQSYTIHHEACSLAEISICAYSDTIIDEMGIVNWCVIPRTIDEAISVLQRAIEDGKIEAKDIYKALYDRAVKKE